MRISCFDETYFRVGEVNIAFNVNPSCRTAASEIQFLQHYLRFIVSDSGGVILAFPNHTIQLVYNVFGRGALVKTQCSISTLHEKSRSRRTDLCEHHAIVVTARHFTRK